jgi:hypothetical protein
MTSRGGLALAFVVLAACSGTPKQTTPVDPAGGDNGGDDQTDCEPGRCLEDISKAVSERRDDARQCFDEGRKRDPKLPGLLIINFAIDAEGVVGETSQGMQDAQLADQQVIDCVSEVIKGVRFAKSAKGKTTRAYHRFEFGG